MLPVSSIVSDRISHLMRPLRRLWGLDQESTPRDKPTSSTNLNQYDDLVDLDRILILLARPAGAREPIRLMSRQMSLHEATFHSRGELTTGQDFQVQMLLEPGFSLQVHARVAEASRVDGECRGRLQFSCGAFERGAISTYLSKRNVR